MPEVTARTPVGAAIQAAKEVVKVDANRRADTPEVPTPTKEVTGQDDAREQAFVRRERALRNQQRELMQLKQQLEQMQKPQQDPAAMRDKMLADLRERIANDPMAAVSELGLEIHSLRDSQTAAQKLFEQQKQEAEALADKHLMTSVRSLVASNPEFEAVKAMGAEEAVKELVKLSISEGDELSIEEAAQRIEDYLVAETLKAAGISKIKAKLTPQEAAQLAADDTQQSHQPAPTINSGIPRTQASMSSKDKRARAIMRAQGLDPDTGKPLQPLR